MELKQAQEYYELGVLKNLTIVRDGEGWMLVITGKKGQSWTLHTARGAIRNYKTADAAISDMIRICDSVSELGMRL